MSEDTDAFVINPNRRTFSSLILKADLASQRRPDCPYKALSFQTLRHPQFLSNFQSPKLNLSVSGKKNVFLFGVMTKTPVLSEKKRTFKVVNTH